MSYEITITETKTVEKTINPEWKKIGEEEVERDTRWSDGDDEPKTRISEVMGYTPSIEKSIEETSEIYRQTVEVLDMSDVIKSINNLK